MILAIDGEEFARGCQHHRLVAPPARIVVDAVADHDVGTRLRGQRLQLGGVLNLRVEAQAEFRPHHENGSLRGCPACLFCQLGQPRLLGVRIRVTRQEESVLDRRHPHGRRIPG